MEKKHTRREGIHRVETYVRRKHKIKGLYGINTALRKERWECTKKRYTIETRYIWKRNTYEEKIQTEREQITEKMQSTKRYIYKIEIYTEDIYGKQII